MTQIEDPTHFACCDCGADLVSLDGCRACGRVFERRDDCPNLFPTADRRYEVKIRSGMLDPAKIPAQSVFRYPARSGQASTGLYHLDQAHADMLETLPRGSLILEIGCGGGQMRAWAHERGLRYLGTDVSKTRVHDWLQEHGGADILCDAHALPLRSNSVDAVYGSAVWEHLAFPQLAAQETARVLKPGGLFLGSSSFLEPWHDESFYHNTPNGVYMTLTLAGLRPEYVWPEISWPGFRALMVMGNKATRAIAVLGAVMNWYYLAPKRIQLRLRNGRWPGPDELYQARAQLSGAIAWIARSPTVEGAE